MSDPPIEDGWQRWRGKTDARLLSIDDKQDLLHECVSEIKATLGEHIKDENGLLRVILVSVLSLLTAAGVAILVYVLNHL
jgi:hypothetical protein